MNPLQKEILALIGNDQIDGAITQLSDYLEDTDDIMTLTNLSRRYSRAKGIMRDKVGSESEISVELSAITNSLMQLVIESSLNPEPVADKNKKGKSENDPQYKFVDGKLRVFFCHSSPFNKEQEAYEKALKDLFLKYDILLEEGVWGEKKPMMHIREQMEEVSGCVILAYERMKVSNAVVRRDSDREEKLKDFVLPSMWVQMEAGMAYQAGLPILVIKQEAIPNDAIFDVNAHEFNIAIVSGDSPKELAENRTIQSWAEYIKKKAYAS